VKASLKIKIVKLCGAVSFMRGLHVCMCISCHALLLDEVTCVHMHQLAIA
jgi:hypothetical protein